MINVAEAIVAALAVWRISTMVTSEEGPFEVFAKLRRLFGVEEFDSPGGYVRGVVLDDGLVEEEYVGYVQPSSKPTGAQPSWVQRGLICIWCVSFWVSILIGPVAWLHWGMPLGWLGIVVVPMALSTAAIVVDNVVGVLE